jgi:hypothetical protein
MKVSSRIVKRFGAGAGARLRRRRRIRIRRKKRTFSLVFVTRGPGQPPE